MTLVANPFIRSGVVPADRVIMTRVKASRVLSPLLVPGGSLGIYGERGVGKSSLLCYIASTPTSLERDERFQNHIFVSFNCDIVMPVSTAEFWFQAVWHLYHTVRSDPIRSKCQALLARREEGSELGPADFHSVLDVAGRAEKRIVLMLDDFDTLIRTESQRLDATRVFLQGLRSCTTRDSNKANLVVNTRRSLEDLCGPVTKLGVSPFPNGFTLYRLRLFRESEIDQLLQWVDETCQPPFSLAESSYVRYLSGSYPQLAQIAAAGIFDRRLEVDQAPLDDLTPAGERFKSEANRLFESIWEAASEVERMLLTAIALQGLEGRLPKTQYDLKDLAVIFSQRERELVELTARGLLRRTQNDPPSWSVFSPIFEWWILKEIQSINPKRLQDYRKVWANLLTQKQANRLGKLLESVRNNLDVIERIGRAVIGMAGLNLPNST